MTLITAILYAVVSIIGLINFSDSADAFDATSELLGKEYPFISFCMVIIRYTQLAFPIFVAIGLFMLFFQAQNRNSEQPPVAGLNSIFSDAVIATICYLTLSLLLAIFLYQIFNLMSEVGSQMKDSARSDANTALFILLLFIAVLCTYAGSFSLFASSIKNTATTPSLFANGATVFAVSNFLLALSIILGGSYLSSELGDLSSLVNVSDEFTFSTMVSLALYVITGIYALLYSSHISKAGDGGVNIPDYSSAPSAPASGKFPSNGSYSPSTDSPVSTSPARPASNNFCTVCGNKIDPQNKFCGKCGTKLK